MKSPDWKCQISYENSLFGSAKFHMKSPDRKCQILYENSLFGSAKFHMKSPDWKCQISYENSLFGSAKFHMKTISVWNYQIYEIPWLEVPEFQMKILCLEAPNFTWTYETISVCNCQISNKPMKFPDWKCQISYENSLLWKYPVSYEHMKFPDWKCKK